MDRRLAKLAVLLIVNGIIVSVITRWLYSTKACGVHCGKKHPLYRPFNHPFVLALLRCLGKFAFFLLYVIVHVVRSIVSTNQQTTVEPFLPCCQWFAMLPAAVASVMGLLTNFLGVKLAPTSVSLLFLGTAVIFTGCLSRVFLTMMIRRHQWLGILVVSLGATLIGSVDLIFNGNQITPQTNIRSIMSGSLLILLGEVVSSAQSVLEQRYIRMYNINAMLAVGLEGLFGSIVIGAMLYPLQHITINFPLTDDPDHRLENTMDAFAMIGQNKQILLCLIGLMFGGATYSYIGMIILKDYSAVTRAVLSCGKVTITFLQNCTLGWAKSKPEALALQIPGSLMNIFVGQFLYFDVILAPLWRNCRESRQRVSPEPSENDENDYVDDADTLDNSECNEITFLESDNSVNERTRLLTNS